MPLEVLAWTMVGVAQVMLVLVFLRMCCHHLQVLRGREVWGDPVTTELDASAKKAEDPEERGQTV